MKNISKAIGSIAFVAILVFSMTGCATIDDIINPKATAFDKSVPKDQMATLHYAEDIRIQKLDGKENLSPLGLGPLSYQGVGTIVERDVAKLKTQTEIVMWYPEPKKGALRIPAGEHTLTGIYHQGDLLGWVKDPIELKFNFEAGKHYFIRFITDPAYEAQKEAEYNAAVAANSAAAAASFVGQGFKDAFTSGGIPQIFTCIDITNEKGKAYERSDKKK